MSKPQLPDSDRKFLCHFAGGGFNIIVTTVMADFLKFLIGHGNFCDYFDYYSGVSSGAMTIAAALVPSDKNPNAPLHPDFRSIRHGILYANDDVFDEMIARRFVRRQFVSHLVSSWPDWMKESRGVSHLFNWLTDPDRLYFSSENIEKMIERVIKKSDTTLNDLLRPFLCPSIRIDGPSEYHFHTNQQWDDGLNTESNNEYLIKSLRATMRLVPLLPPDQSDPRIDGGSLFTGIDAAETLDDLSIETANITFFDCMDAPKWDITLADLNKRTDQSAFAGLRAERAASRQQNERNFKKRYPNAHYQMFSRRLPQNSFVGSPPVQLMEKFCNEYCYRSYSEVLNTPIYPIDLLESVMKPDRQMHAQMVAQAIRACAARLPDMVKLAKKIIHGPLARHKNLSPAEQDELISRLDARLNPTPHRFREIDTSNSSWPTSELDLAAS